MPLHIKCSCSKIWISTDFMHHTDLFFKNLQWLQLLGIKISRLQQAHLVYLINKNKQLLSKIICQQVTAHENTWLSCTSAWSYLPFTLWRHQQLHRTPNFIHHFLNLLNLPHILNMCLITIQYSSFYRILEWLQFTEVFTFYVNAFINLYTKI